MWRYLVKPKDCSTPTSTLSQEVKEKCDEEVNKEVQKKKRKGSKHSHYTPEIRAKIGRYAAENGNSSASQKFRVPESTVRGFKTQYLQKLKHVKDPENITTLHHKLLGRPLKLGSLDKEVQKYITELLSTGAVVNRSIVKGAAAGIIKYYKPSDATNIEITDSWARSILNRMNLVKRKGELAYGLWSLSQVRKLVTLNLSKERRVV